MKYEIKVPNLVGGTYMEEYAKTELYCPLCGEKEVYVETGPGYYYQGSEYLCLSCNSGHCLDFSSKNSSSIKFDLLRKAITSENNEEVLNHYKIGM